MKKNIYFSLVLFFYSLQQYGQFKFSGNVDEEYLNATVHLSIIEDYKKHSNLDIKNILASCQTDSLGYFIFKGDFLAEKDLMYKIYIDKCAENIQHTKHLLNKCVDYKSIHFIANANDSIHFSLNSLGQMLCDFSSTRKENTYVKQLDSLQEHLLSGIEKSLNEKQRKLIYKNYFTSLKGYSETLQHPLAELYAYNLYANENEFSSEFYLSDLKNSNYYSKLNDKLHKEYHNKLSDDFNNDLQTDLFKLNKTKPNYWLYLLFIALSTSLFFNFWFWYRKRRKQKTIDYKTVLTKQELKIFTEIQNGLSNKEIADKLFISLSTVKTHINNIYSKLKISSRKEIGDL